MFLAVDQGVDVVGGEFDVVAMSDRVGGASFDTIAAKNAARVVNVVHLRVTFASGDTLGVSIFGRLDVYAICGASGGAKEATHALFKSVFIPLEYVNAAIARLNTCGNVGIALRSRLAEHRAQGDAEAFVEGEKCFADFPNY